MCKNCGTTLGIMESSLEVCMNDDNIGIYKIKYGKKDTLQLYCLDCFLKKKGKNIKNDVK